MSSRVSTMIVIPPVVAWSQLREDPKIRGLEKQQLGWKKQLAWNQSPVNCCRISSVHSKPRPPPKKNYAFCLCSSSSSGRFFLGGWECPQEVTGSPCRPLETWQSTATEISIYLGFPSEGCNSKILIWGLSTDPGIIPTSVGVECLRLMSSQIQ